MIVVFAAFAGAGVATVICLAWLAVDLLAGTSTLTEDRAAGVFAGCVALSQPAWLGFWIWLEFVESR